MAILGSDDRIEIKTAAAGSLPYSVYVQIAAKFPNGGVTQGSGVMVGANDVLTVAHSLYNPDFGGWATQIQVSPGRHEGKLPFGLFEGKQISAPLEWQNSGSIGYDYGVISLSTDIGYVTGWLEYGYVSTVKDLEGRTISTVGYPGDKGGNTQYFSQGTVDVTTATTLRFTDDLDVMGGQSGAPVVYSSAQSEIVLGLVGQELPEENIAVALSATSVEQIEGWISGNSVERELSGLNPALSQVSSDNTIDLQVARMAELLFDQQLGYLVLESYRKIAAQQGIEAVASTMIQSYTTFSQDSFVVYQLVNNLQLSGSAKTIAEDFLTNSLGLATTQDARGKVILDAGDILSGLTDDALFGSYAVGFNTEVTNALAYSAVPLHFGVREVDAAFSGEVLHSVDWMLL